MSKDIVLVSNNPGKIKEFREILSPFGFNLLSLKDINCNIEIEEHGKSYAENALIKARYFHKKFPLVIADDSGLEITALNNKPGLYSARFLGKDTAANIKNQKIIHMLEGESDRSAKFICSIALIYNGIELVFNGEVQGQISKTIRGEKGFAYDFIFLLPQYNKTFSELDTGIKNKISHRGVALKKLEEWLKNEKI